MSSMQQRLHHAQDFTPAARATYLCARRHAFGLEAANALARVCLSVENGGRSGAIAYDRCHQIIRKSRAPRPALIPEPVTLTAPQRLPINALTPAERVLLSHYRLAAADDRRRVRNWLATASA